MFFDPLYWMLLGPGLILALIATVKTKMTFHRYSRVAAASGLTGAQAARRLLDSQGAGDVRVEQVDGFLSDHYDPTSHTLRLSTDVYDSPSLSAIGVACHEAGHALQQATGYAWLNLRTALVPATQFGNFGSYIFIMLGIIINSMHLS